MNKDQQDWIDCLKSKMDEEGFDYCFQDYSDWKEIDDEMFHGLRLQYIGAARKLKDYVENL